MGTLSKISLETEYLSGKSMWEVSQKLGCSVHKVTYWMAKYGIPKRSRSEAMYFKLNPKGDPFKINTPDTPHLQFLLGLGLGIYWGEGNKADRNQVRVTNSDPFILVIFREFLYKICNLKSEKIKYSIICFNDAPAQRAASYWSQELSIPASKFGKIVQIPPQGKGTYRRKSQYGVCSLSVSNIKLKSWIMGQMDLLKSPDSSTAERALGKG